MTSGIVGVPTQTSQAIYKQSINLQGGFKITFDMKLTDEIKLMDEDHELVSFYKPGEGEEPGEGEVEKWRSDGRCGVEFPMNGKPGRCDPGGNGNRKGPCCSIMGYCGNTAAHCTCKECVDFRKDTKISNGTQQSDGYGLWIKTEWCADNVDIERICDGSEDDCLAKGKAKCDNDPKCFGVMFHPLGWSKSKKGVKLCTSRKMSKQGQWMTFLKGYVDTSDVQISLSINRKAADAKKPQTLVQSTFTMHVRDENMMKINADGLMMQLDEWTSVEITVTQEGGRTFLVDIYVKGVALVRATKFSATHEDWKRLLLGTKRYAYSAAKGFIRNIVVRKKL